MPSAGFELAISAIKLLQICASDSTTTGTGKTGIIKPMLYGASGTLLRVLATEDPSRSRRSRDKKQQQI
jgi:hypothetical protein